jgi:hypothetical protein
VKNNLKKDEITAVDIRYGGNQTSVTKIGLK